VETEKKIKETYNLFQCCTEQIVETEKKNWKGATVKKPEIIPECKKFMRGVDKEYQILHFYPCCGKTMKCVKKFLFFLATHGCPKQFHVVQKIITPQTKIKSGKALCFQRLHT
jgi:hypothetical protein